MAGQNYVISVGGSIIVPSVGVNVKFLRELKKLISARLKKGDSFFLIAGGGSTARQYIKTANLVNHLKPTESDWLGIYATRLNAQLVKMIFGDLAYEEIIIDPHQSIKTKKKLIIASGYRPGNSTDYVATLLAEKYSFKKIINLSNIEYVFDKDPRKFKDAKRLEKITWPDFQKIVGTTWRPGLSAPFDPIASKLAKKLGLEVIIMNGLNLKNLQNYFLGKKFKGTVVK